MKVQRCKGTRDLSPQEMKHFRAIEGVFRDVCLKGAYEEVKTPLLEYLYLFTSAGTLTPAMLSKVYSFLDWDGWSGERVVLRPDATIPVARYYIDNLPEQELARLFYVTNIFSFEESGKESRERWQCGTELIGPNSPAADVELVDLALNALMKAGFKDVEVRLSHAGLIQALLAKLELSAEEQHAVFDRIMDGDTDALARIKEGKPELADALALLINMKGESSGFLRNLKALLNHKLADLAPAIDNFTAIAELLTALGYDYKIDITSGRGFEYYTGFIFQLFKDGEKVGGGGRYDNLIPLMGGKNVPASGFALYLDRLVKLMPPEPPDKPVGHRVLVSFQEQTAEAEKQGFAVAGCFREAGYVAEMNLNQRAATGREWSLTIHTKPSKLVLVDPTGHRKFDLSTPGEAVVIIGG